MIKVFIKPLNLEVEAKRLPYHYNENPTQESRDIIIEAIDGRVFVVNRDQDYLVEFDSYAEKNKADADLEFYYRTCLQYRIYCMETADTYSQSVPEIMEILPFTKYYEMKKARRMSS